MKHPEARRFEEPVRRSSTTARSRYPLVPPGEDAGLCCTENQRIARAFQVILKVRSVVGVQLRKKISPPREGRDSVQRSDQIGKCVGLYNERFGTGSKEAARKVSQCDPALGYISTIRSNWLQPVRTQAHQQSSSVRTKPS